MVGIPAVQWLARKRDERISRYLDSYPSTAYTRTVRWYGGSNIGVYLRIEFGGWIILFFKPSDGGGRRAQSVLGAECVSRVRSPLRMEG